MRSPTTRRGPTTSTGMVEHVLDQALDAGQEGAAAAELDAPLDSLHGVVAQQVVADHSEELPQAQVDNLLDGGHRHLAGADHAAADRHAAGAAVVPEDHRAVAGQIPEDGRALRCSPAAGPMWRSFTRCSQPTVSWPA